VGVFDAQGQIFTEPGFNGCAHMTANAEARHGGPVEHGTDRYRQWVRTLFTDLAQEAGVADPEDLARQLHLLYDGAGVSARMDRDPTAATTARGDCGAPRRGGKGRATSRPQVGGSGPCPGKACRGCPPATWRPRRGATRLAPGRHLRRPLALGQEIHGGV
jgi:hypothetical protein